MIIKLIFALTILFILAVVGLLTLVYQDVLIDDLVDGDYF